MTPVNRNKTVVAHSVNPHAPLHEVETNRALARWLAQILGIEYGGSYDSQQHAGSDLYLLPTQTLIGPQAARQLGVSGPDDLWGGYVEHDFICTKAITHGLSNKDAVAPIGWSPLFAKLARSVVLDGVSVFSLKDARQAAEHLLYTGPIRFKPIHACAGRDQRVIQNLAQFDEIAADPGAQAVFRDGVVLEQNLDEVRTQSVGQSSIHGNNLSYCGVQHLTRDSQGLEVYGGSDLLVVQGGYIELLRLELPDEMREAVRLAQVFDDAANQAYPGFFASRRNYDIAQGIDAGGQPRGGVLEQSWRMGGASSAELAALQVFVQEPSTGVIRVSSVETYIDQPLPPGAMEVYRGPAHNGDFLLKYVTVHSHDG
ncbi:MULTISPECIES: DUF3182 family protein [unclassified Pseudomonas]|uniref:DUF3182 family protein n=1 Tax=unclassified Pseudomonas TaxID=196821 RepID=UPI00119955E1|nr:MULTISPECIES: DUF3182 family protein [unclassified Pseudomonas]TWC11129.1 uncharacterized protein DUF3182 [Pseudomonas sp. SJZ075]TWC14157.1 uncharacterized protein DUF3182 [Pseudomonas sp. SJZ074]TWC27970.1 uncharacterized protein DUF3182 [Pseudomonas sp. SJZ078]TWC32672.1 uncharacterized protein DUF3182 [Pseudomonas sp. SJZ085]TWC47575.1 uncharacterized protein DUF3182 [Pseudomonas sp. SJZ124]